MKRFGIVSYNIHCNFTNYGSALQSWALQQATDRLGKGRWETILVDYCPDILRDKNPRDPIAHMWDTDEESRRMCRLSLPALVKNADKFDEFYHTRFHKTKRAYTSENFDHVVLEEMLDGFICGSDTIFCIDEFGGFEDGYYANYSCMKGHSVAYAASFGDAQFTTDTLMILRDRLQNFQALGLRESSMLPFVQENVSVPVQRVLDPTLLLTMEDYGPITAKRQEERPYLLLYARRYNAKMSAYAEKIAVENGLEIIEISLWAENAGKHRMFYEAGVEEFLSLVKCAECVVTNSYHGMIFSIQFRRPFFVFSREQCSSKIAELLELLGLSDRLMLTGREQPKLEINFEAVHAVIQRERERSMRFLSEILSDIG